MVGELSNATAVAQGISELLVVCKDILYERLGTSFTIRLSVIIP
jgi:hypothetical protein